MDNFLKWIWGRGDNSPDKVRDMRDVMRRVDQQVGRAVERLSDR